MEPRKMTGKWVHNAMGNGYPEHGTASPLSLTRTGKRIVSKGEYVQRQADRALAGLFGGCLLFVAILCALFAIGSCLGFLACLWFAHSQGHIWQAMGMASICLFLTVLTGSGAYFLLTISLVLMNDVAKIDPGVPFTRANTAHLSAPESLVRASEEPMQAQKAVLLRAIIEGQDRHEEQLLRAAVGEQEPPL